MTMYIAADIFNFNILPDIPSEKFIFVRRISADELKDMIVSMIQRNKTHKIVFKDEKSAEILAKVIGIKINATINNSIKLKHKDSIVVIQQKASKDKTEEAEQYELYFIKLRLFCD